MYGEEFLGGRLFGVNDGEREILVRRHRFVETAEHLLEGFGYERAQAGGQVGGDERLVRFAIGLGGHQEKAGQRRALPRPSRRRPDGDRSVLGVKEGRIE